MEVAEELIESTAHLKLETVWAFIKKTGCMFYIMNPKEHLYESVEEVPDYYKEVTPSFVFVIILEVILRFLRGKPALRLNDTITNMCQGMLIEIFKIPFHGVELIVYMWIYNNYRVTTLPWNSVWTWLFGMVAGDFFFYWMHRATHQISFLWNFHEPHHSSEEYNLSVPMRLHIFTSQSFWCTYFPLALAVPPQIFLVHYQLVIIFQYWLHSELYPSLGPFEWIFNTPRFHRVHHGRNRRYIDKNFASIFIIWDRMFGTFEPDTNIDDIKYGVTKPIKTFNPIWIQTNFFWPMIKKFREVKGFKNKMWALVKGPGWSPGGPWLGNLEEIPEPLPDEPKYDPQIPLWMNAYALVHFAVIGVSYLQLMSYHENLPAVTVLSSSLFIMLSTISIGVIFDGRPWIPFLEIVRCLLYFAFEYALVTQVGNVSALMRFRFRAFRVLFVGSFFLWLFISADMFATIREAWSHFKKDVRLYTGKNDKALKKL